MSAISLIPRDRAFFDLFVEAGENTLRAALLLREMLDKWPDDPGGLARDILKAEQEGDRITQEIVRRLNSEPVRTIDASEVYALATQLDDIVENVSFTAHARTVPLTGRPSRGERDRARVTG